MWHQSKFTWLKENNVYVQVSLWEYMDKDKHTSLCHVIFKFDLQNKFVFTKFQIDTLDFKIRRCNICQPTWYYQGCLIQENLIAA